MNLGLNHSAFLHPIPPSYPTLIYLVETIDCTRRINHHDAATKENVYGWVLHEDIIKPRGKSRTTLKWIRKRCKALLAGKDYLRQC